MDFHQLRCFVAVAEELHFGHAATRLHVSQPALSQTIRRLEREIGLELLVRSSRHVSLTDAGEAFVEGARRVLEQQQRMLESAHGAASGSLGKLRVGYSPSLRETAARLLIDFAHESPGVEVGNRQEYTLPLLAAVEEGTLDGAFVFAAVAPRHLCFEAVRDVPLACHVGSNHPLARRESVSLEEVAAYPVARPNVPDAAFWPGLLEEALERYGVRPTFMDADEPLNRLPVADSRAVWLLSRELYLSDSVCVPLEPTVLFRFAFVWHAERASNPLLAFVDFIRAVRDREQWVVRRASSRAATIVAGRSGL